MGSGKLVRYSLSKHGREMHAKEILATYATREELIAAEIALVTQEVVDDPLSMNLRVGGCGGGGWTPEQQRKNNAKGNARMKALRQDPEWKAQLSRHLSEAHKKAYAEGRRNNDALIARNKSSVVIP